ncbi:MAG: single-stranded-DNA-specific exonuclease RecJ [Christensenellaceae bacterium]|jgi:single-stranded-DNA-specific exonuclease|nr:single-stranded-DNA-specific exonuclease RecJ [Christensenellaceae bacterium]
MKYRAICGGLTPEQVAEFEGTGYSKNFVRLLVSRGIDTQEKAREFFDYDLEKLHNPFLLKGMKEVVARIRTAIEKKQHVLIVGDYDCDGICATAILYSFLCSKQCKVSYYLPERDADGYGLNCELIEALNEKFLPNVLITVDCGISCHKEIKFARSLGIDCLVTDHHAIPEIIPDCPCVDPKFDKQDYPFNDLCGAGVALKLVQAFDGIAAVKKYLDIASLATVADIVSLRDENRIIVHHGLEMLNRGSNIGISALARRCKVMGPIKSSDIGYKLAPKLNAAGRMGNAKHGLDIILTKDSLRVKEKVDFLMDVNTKRQEIGNKIYAEVIDEIESKRIYDNNIIIAARPEWESGVLGIVAARVTDKYNKPTIILGGNGKVYKGSGRSVGSVNLVEIAGRFADILISFGGHFMAIGLTIDKEKLDEWAVKMNEAVGNLQAGVETDKYYDMEIKLEEFTPQFLNELDMLQPVGCDNNNPIFMTVIGRTNTETMSKYREHTKFFTGELRFVYFYGSIFNDILQSPCEKSVIFELNGGSAMVKCVIPFAVNEEDNALVLERYLSGDLVTEPEQTILDIVHNLSIDRELFVCYYKEVRGLVCHGNVLDIYKRIKLRDKNLYQFVFCFSVFKELNILSGNEEKTELDRSIIYSKVKGMR